MGGIETERPEIDRQRRRWRFASAKYVEALRELRLRPGDVVTKDELLDAVWPVGTVGEASLATAMTKLRRALGAGPADDGVIETVPRLGYRLIAPVEVEFRGMPAIG